MITFYALVKQSKTQKRLNTNYRECMTKTFIYNLLRFKRY